MPTLANRCFRSTVNADRMSALSTSGGERPSLARRAAAIVPLSTSHVQLCDDSRSGFPIFERLPSAQFSRAFWGQPWGQLGFVSIAFHSRVRFPPPPPERGHRFPIDTKFATRSACRTGRMASISVAFRHWPTRASVQVRDRSQSASLRRPAERHPGMTWARPHTSAFTALTTLSIPLADRPSVRSVN
jgi:hypothetical protein